MNYKDFYSFTVVFKQVKEDLSWIVSCPDIRPFVAKGQTFQEASYNAKKAFGITLFTMELERVEIPEPTSPENMEPEGLFMQMEVYMPLYRKAIQNKSIKKTLTIPEWLNEAALREDINFSQVLQDALKEQLNIKLPQ